MEDALKNKDLDNFNRYIGNAEAIATDTDTMAKINCLRARGLYFFKRYDSALKAIEEALKYPQNETDYIRLLRSKACIFTYKGQFKESILEFKKLLTETSEPRLLVEISLNMAWSLLESYKKDPRIAVLDEAKLYLDTSYKEIEVLDHVAMKRNVFANYAEFFKLKGDYDMCIEMLEEGFTFRGAFSKSL